MKKRVEVKDNATAASNATKELEVCCETPSFFIEYSTRYFLYIHLKELAVLCYCFYIKIAGNQTSFHCVHIMYV